MKTAAQQWNVGDRKFLSCMWLASWDRFTNERHTVQNKKGKLKMRQKSQRTPNMAMRTKLRKRHFLFPWTSFLPLIFRHVQGTKRTNQDHLVFTLRCVYNRCSWFVLFVPCTRLKKRGRKLVHGNKICPFVWDLLRVCFSLSLSFPISTTFVQKGICRNVLLMHIQTKAQWKQERKKGNGASVIWWRHSLRMPQVNAYCNFTNFRCVKISVASDRGAFGVV